MNKGAEEIKQEGFGKKLFWEGISLVFLYVRCEEIAIYS